MENVILRPTDVVAERDGALHRHEHSDVAAFVGELSRQGEQRCRLADLARGVEDEIELVVDQAADVRQPREHGQRVVVLGIVGTASVEATGHARTVRARAHRVKRPDVSRIRHRKGYPGRYAAYCAAGSGVGSSLTGRRSAQAARIASAGVSTMW